VVLAFIVHPPHYHCGEFPQAKYSVLPGMRSCSIFLQGKALILQGRSRQAFYREIEKLPCNFPVFGCIEMYAGSIGSDPDGVEDIVSLNRTDRLILLGTLACLPLTSCSRVVAHANTTPPEGVPVRAVIATVRDVPLEITAVGNVEAMESVEVKSLIAGQIKRVAFAEGQNVSKGQLLFAIDREALERQAAEQKAELERDVAMEQQARALVARDAASQKQSQSEAEVAVQLGKLGVLSGQRVDQLVTASATTGAGLRSNQAAVDAAEGATKADRARLAQTQLQLNYTDIAAPISGRAGAAMVKGGNIVRENDTTLVTLLQLAPIYITFGIPEQVLAQVQQLNAHAPMTVEAKSNDGLSYEGHLAFIDNTVDSSTGTVRLKAVFPNADNKLWPGEFVPVRLRLRMEKGQIVVPSSSVQDGLDGKYAWSIQADTAAMKPVTVLRTYKPDDGPELAVLGSGIHPGDVVVSEGQLRLTPGARVSLLSAPREPFMSKPAS
jgi:membrane fusion protein, multidrug efflux system